MSPREIENNAYAIFFRGGGKIGVLWDLYEWRIHHFTVLCSVTRLLNKSEAGVDLALL